MHAKDLALWFLLAWLWGSSFLAIGIGVETLDPTLLVAVRMIIGALILVAFLYAIGGHLKLGQRGWLIAATVGFTGNVVPFLLISFAELLVDSGLAALFMGFAPVVTLAIAPFVHSEETLGRSKVIGAVLGFSGIVVLVGPDAIFGMGGDFVPKLALIGAALCYAFTALFTRRFSHAIPLQIATGSVLLGAIMIVAMAGFSVPISEISKPSLRSFFAAIYLGLGPTAIAALIYFYLIPRIGAGRLQQVNYVVPLLGTILGVAFLGERPEWNVAIAIPMIALAVYFVSKKATI
ncbi:DMT family transporter [Kiloniella majae]|uniref:DMT family transporter n=1 Tax=Kiloniella majae TaxID=1938558 RepID=UPI000A277BC1|nr:DMT family transporter [Kiloniella majae]